MEELEFKVMLGIVAVILATCSLVANFVLIEICCMRIEKAADREQGREWKEEHEREVRRIQKRREKNRSATIKKWLRDVSDTQSYEKKRCRMLIDRQA